MDARGVQREDHGEVGSATDYAIKNRGLSAALVGTDWQIANHPACGAGLVEWI